MDSFRTKRFSCFEKDLRNVVIFYDDIFKSDIMRAAIAALQGRSSERMWFLSNEIYKFLYLCNI